MQLEIKAIHTLSYNVSSGLEQTLNDAQLPSTPAVYNSRFDTTLGDFKVGAVIIRVFGNVSGAAVTRAILKLGLCPAIWPELISCYRQFPESMPRGLMGLGSTYTDPQSRTTRAARISWDGAQYVATTTEIQIKSLDSPDYLAILP